MNSATTAVFGVTHSLSGTPWHWRCDPAEGQRLAQRHGLADALGQILAGRGVTPETVAQVLTPTLRDALPDPTLFIDMDKATQRLADALMRDEAIVIFGDYDVDGATSSALLLHLLRTLGGTKVSTYIPDRLLEGYGPSVAALESIHAGGARLLITVDCGAQAFEPLECAQTLGLDVVVVDHHKCGWSLPPAVAIVNPNRLDCPAGAQFGHLAAVGVAFVLAVSLNRLLRERGWFSPDRPEPALLPLLDLVAVGTVADVVPLTGLNRAFVTQGLKILQKRTNPGLAALFDVAKINRPADAGHLAFHIAPRINAGGRVGQADTGVRLLTTADAGEAASLATLLNDWNSDRRTLEAETLEAAAASAFDPESPVIVAAGAGWHPGVIGIVASRLKDRFNRPTVVIGWDENGVGKGSGRSISGVDLGGAVIAAREAGLLLAGGGHAMAAGLTIARNQIEALRAFLNDQLAASIAKASEGRARLIDIALAPGGASAPFALSLAHAGPYGAGWPGPKVAIGPVQIVKADIVGADHLRLIVTGRDGARLKAMGFRLATTEMGAALMAARNRSLALAGRLVWDDWSGQPTAELHLEDAAFLD